MYILIYVIGVILAFILNCKYFVKYMNDTNKLNDSDTIFTILTSLFSWIDVSVILLFLGFYYLNQLTGSELTIVTN